MKRGKELKLAESVNDLRQLEGEGFSVLKHSSVNGSINDLVTTITFNFNCGIYFVTLKINIFAPDFII